MMQELFPSLVMVLLQLEFAVMNILSKLALDTGMNPYIHVTYRQLFAAVTLSPLAYFVERGKRPPMTLAVFIQVFICSMFGLTLNQITYFVGLKNSTPTIACALSNLLPALTFVLAVIFKQESGKLKTLGGQAKLIGTLAGVGGAMILSVYNGPTLPIGVSSIHLKLADTAKDPNHNGGEGNLLGPFLVIISALTWAIWFTFQAKVCDKYPAPYSWSAMMLAMGTVECALFGYIMEPNLREWALAPVIRAYSSIYAGVVCSAMGICMMSWCIKKKGPLFVSVFSPLLLVIVSIFSWAFLREKIYLGTVLGSVLIVMGLYGVLWGKSKEMEMEPQNQQQEAIQDTKDDMEMQ